MPDQSCACAAVDIAVLDWVGRRLSMPLYRLFGLDASKAPVTTFSIGIDTPEVMKHKVPEAKDFPVLKIKVGMANDEQIIGAVREATDRSAWMPTRAGTTRSRPEEDPLVATHGRRADRAGAAGGHGR